MADSMQDQITEIHKRVFNGLGKELRSEIADEMRKLYKAIGGLLLTLLLLFAGIIIEGRVSSKAATDENDRNYRAIMEIDKKVEIHIQTTDGDR